MRTIDTPFVANALKDYLVEQDFDVEVWLSNPDNLVLTNSNKDVALFEGQKPGIKVGHYYFTSKGKEAIKAAKEFISEVFFTAEYQTQVIVGTTPITNRKARWFSRHIGFKSNGVLNTNQNCYELFILTKPEWEELNNG